MALSRHERTRRKADLNPLEMIEKVVSANDWPFDRTSDREIAVEVAGRWCDYRMFFSWRDDVEALHFTCAYDVRIPSERHTDIHVLLALINEKMWLGHFDLWTDEGLPMFRHAIPLRGTDGPDARAAERPRRGRDQRKRTLLPRLSVRRVGRQDARRRADRLDSRDGRRSLIPEKDRPTPPLVKT